MLGRILVFVEGENTNHQVEGWVNRCLFRLLVLFVGRNSNRSCLGHPKTRFDSRYCRNGGAVYSV